jgi:hypothetical protein
MSLYIIIILNAINRIKNHICIIDCVFSPIIFFQNRLFITPLIKINTNLHPSSAGIGRRLNTPKLIDIIAQIIRRNIIHSLNALVMKSTIHTGPLTCASASCLSFGVSGVNIFFTRIPSHLKVRSDWLYVSIKPYFIAFKKEYLYSKSLLRVMFSDT